MRLNVARASHAADHRQRVRGAAAGTVRGRRGLPGTRGRERCAQPAVTCQRAPGPDDPAAGSGRSLRRQCAWARAPARSVAESSTADVRVRRRTVLTRAGSRARRSQPPRATASPGPEQDMRSRAVAEGDSARFRTRHAVPSLIRTARSASRSTAIPASSSPARLTTAVERSSGRAVEHLHGRPPVLEARGTVGDAAGADMRSAEKASSSVVPSAAGTVPGPTSWPRASAGRRNKTGASSLLRLGRDIQGSPRTTECQPVPALLSHVVTRLSEADGKH